jgi:hypothetical protein
VDPVILQHRQFRRITLINRDISNINCGVPVPLVPRNLPIPCSGSPTMTACHDSRVIEFYRDELDEIIAAGDIAIILIGVVRDTILIHEANPRLKEMDKCDDRVPSKRF